MHEDFWQARWARNEIGFHQPDINPWLQRYFPRLELARGTRVLVPLCGKSLDMQWLAEHGLSVLGVELAERAVEAFFAERQWVPDVQQEGAFKVYRHGAVEIRCGDFFALQPADVADCLALYDRAAIIALPPSMRCRYAEQLARILPVGCQGLMVTLDYDQTRMDGPPFAVAPDEVRQLLGDAWQLEVLAVKDVLADSPRFQKAGLERLEERVWRLAKTR